MLDDLKKLIGGDATQFAAEVQKLSGKGQFNPFALFAGQTRLHSVFVGPFTPMLAEGRRQLLADGSGPLAGVIESFRQQGAGIDEAKASAQRIFTAAQGMCVVVLANDQGLDTVPQLFFGNLDDEYLDHVVTTCGKEFTHGPELRELLGTLRTRAVDGAALSNLHAGGPANHAEYWSTLATELTHGLDTGMQLAAPERQRDLAWWTAMGALATDGVTPLAADLLPPVLRCAALGGNVAEALDRLAARAGDVDPDDLALVLHQVGDLAIAAGHATTLAAWHTAHAASFATHLDGAYELPQARLKAIAAANPDAEQLRAVVLELFAIDKKSARHDLSREPIWRVHVEDPGELLETAEAATVINRSPTFVSKRLDQGTIPWFRQPAPPGQEAQVRLPRRALVAWKTVLDEYKLLD